MNEGSLGCAGLTPSGPPKIFNMHQKPVVNQANIPLQLDFWHINSGYS